MQVTMTIPNWDLILNPSTRAFYTDCVGELKKVFQQKIVFMRFWFKLFLELIQGVTNLIRDVSKL